MRCILRTCRNNPPTTRSCRNVELCEAADRRRRPVPRLARRAARDVLEENPGVCRALRAGEPDCHRDPAGLRRGDPDGAGSHGGELRLRAETVETAEELRREVAGYQHARREVSSVTRAAAATLIPPWVVAARFCRVSLSTI